MCLQSLRLSPFACLTCPYRAVLPCTKSTENSVRRHAGLRKKCLANDIPVGLGTDTACPFVTHYDMWRELRYFQKYLDVSNEFAIHTATEVNARIAGIDNETGTIEIGKSADFMVVDNNPLENLEALRNPQMVVLRGNVIKIRKSKIPIRRRRIGHVHKMTKSGAIRTAFF